MYDEYNFFTKFLNQTCLRAVKSREAEIGEFQACSGRPFILAVLVYVHDTGWYRRVYIHGERQKDLQPWRVAAHICR